jgi:hypothetical protein
MSILTKLEVKRIKKEALIQRRLVEFQNISNWEMEIDLFKSLKVKADLSGDQQGSSVYNQRVNKLEVDIEFSELVINEINKKLKDEE